MIDGKMEVILSGLGGAFCLLCTCIRGEASGFGPDGMTPVEEGFPIQTLNRSPEHLRFLHKTNYDGVT